MLRLLPGPLLTVTTLEGQEGELTVGARPSGTWDVSPPDEDPDSRRACPHVCTQKCNPSLTGLCPAVATVASALGAAEAAGLGLGSGLWHSLRSHVISLGFTTCGFRLLCVDPLIRLLNGGEGPRLRPEWGLSRINQRKTLKPAGNDVLCPTEIPRRAFQS